MKALINDCLRLIVITLVAGLALGIIYGVTKEPIAMQEAKKQQEAYEAVFPDAEEFTDLEGFSSEAASEVIAQNDNPIEDHAGDVINNVVEAKDGSGNVTGYIFDITTSKGYGGDIELTVGIAADGTVTGYSVLSISETAGLGMNANTPGTWEQQFENKKVDSFTVVKDGSGANDDTKIDAISGATITSKAVTGAINNCLAYFRSIEGGN